MIKLPLSPVVPYLNNPDLESVLQDISNAIYLLADYSFPATDVSAVTLSAPSATAIASTVMVEAGEDLQVGDIVKVLENGTAVKYDDVYSVAIDETTSRVPLVCRTSAVVGNGVACITHGVIQTKQELIPGTYYGVDATGFYPITTYSLSLTVFRGIMGYSLSTSHMLFKRFN